MPAACPLDEGFAPSLLTVAMNMLVLGGTGFIGSHLAERLAASHHHVRVVDRCPNIWDHAVAGVDYRFFELDDRGELDKALEGIEVVFHLISSTVPKTAEENPLYDVQSNLVGSLFLFERCVARRIRKIVYVSSGGTVYGRPVVLPVAESHATEPECFYGATKLAVEKYLALFNRAHGLDYAILRPSNPYGARQNPHGQQGFIAVLCWKVLSDEETVIWGDGSVVRDYVHVTDVAEALARAGTHATPEKIYNVGSGVGVSLNQLVSIIKTLTKKAPRIRYESARGFDVPAIYLDATRAKNSLLWTPSVELDEGISETLDFARTRLFGTGVESVGEAQGA